MTHANARSRDSADRSRLILGALRRLHPFSSLDWQSLNTLARHARLIELPAGRRLRQAGRDAQSICYLLRGRLRSERCGRTQRPSRHALELTGPGFVTLNRVRLLHVDTAPVAFLLRDAGALEEAESGTATAPVCQARDWQLAFLSSHLLSDLPRGHWQQILRSLTPEPQVAGSLVLEAGDSGSSCYILAQGRAEVLRGGQRLRRLVPGDFFGEDALLLCSTRTATVRMCEDGVVMRLEAASFERWLAGALVADAVPDAEPPFSNQRWASLTMNTADGLRERVAELDPCAAYVVSGAPGPSRLAVFLLRGRGIRAVLAAAGGG